MKRMNKETLLRLEDAYVNSDCRIKDILEEFRMCHASLHRCAAKYDWVRLKSIRYTDKFNKAKLLYENSLMTIAQISRQEDIEQSNISAWSNKHNWVKKIDEDKISRIRKMYEGGEILAREICRRENISRNKLRCLLNKEGWKRRRYYGKPLSKEQGEQVYFLYVKQGRSSVYIATLLDVKVGQIKYFVRKMRYVIGKSSVKTIKVEKNNE